MWGGKEKSEGKKHTSTDLFHALFLGELEVVLGLEMHDERARVGVVQRLPPFRELHE
jgi:hypothetical protein